MSRRNWLLASFAWPLLGWTRAAWPSALHLNLAPGLRPWGRGEYRRFGFLVYEATLWAGDDPQRPPLALRLDYKRKIAGKDIAAASIREMRRFVSDQSQLDAWGRQLEQLFPDVRDGDHLIGLWQPEGAFFYQDWRPIGRVDDPLFARCFFAIWLDENTSAPELRAALLKAPGG